MHAQPVRSRLDASGHQVIEITVRGGYHPSAILALAGLPLRLVFRRDDDDICSERVVFSLPRLDRRLAPAGMTMIDLPAQPPGQVRFTCGMGRYRGQIELVEERTPSLAARLRVMATRLETPLETAIILWICSLPLIVLIAALTFDVTATIAAAGAALAAWVAGCLWVFGRSAPSS